MSIPRASKSMQETGSIKVSTISQAAPSPATPDEPVKVTPPYLRYSVPAELKKIQAARAAIAKRMMMQGEGGAEDAAASATKIDGLRQTGGGPGHPADTAGVTRQVASRVASRSGTVLTDAIVANPPGDAQAKTAAPAATVAIVPNETVNVGFWCDTTFRATTPNKGDEYSWDLFFEGGESYALPDTKKNSIDFVLDGETYKLGAYYGKGSAKFKVSCKTYTAVGPDPIAESETVVLKFSQSTPCLKLVSATLSADSVKGGDENKDLTLTVTLTGPAGPGGHQILLSTDKPKKAQIHGTGVLLIPEGKTSEPLSWFLGTKNVLVDHKVRITAKFNGDEANAYITIKK